VQLPDDMVFEDDAPFLFDFDGDDEPEIVTVESHEELGSRLAIYARAGVATVRIAATPWIGTRHRWIAQAGVRDLDGDGVAEIAYVDRPHLDRVLRIWQLRDGALVEVASAPGFTNHRFGEPAISGGIRTCGGRTELVLASADWSALMAVTLRDGRLTARQIGTDTSPEGFGRALACG
jgi:hypothetical protein